MSFYTTQEEPGMIRGTPRTEFISFLTIMSRENGDGRETIEVSTIRNHSRPGPFVETLVYRVVGKGPRNELQYEEMEGPILGMADIHLRHFGKVFEMMGRGYEYFATIQSGHI